MNSEEWRGVPGYEGLYEVSSLGRARSVTRAAICNGKRRTLRRATGIILKLTPATDYVLGFPQTAAAVIFDSRSPLPRTRMLPGSCFNLSAIGPDGAWFRVEFSTDLVNWTPVCTNQVVNGGIDFVDPDAHSATARFYRTLPEAAPPSQ